MTDHTHVVVHKRHIRSGDHSEEDTEEPKVVYEVGDEITPTERELEANADRFEPIGSDDEEPADEADEPEADEADEPEDEAPPDLDPAEVETAEYQDLQTMASAFEDIKGNASEDRLRADLMAKAEE